MAYWMANKVYLYSMLGATFPEPSNNNIRTACETHLNSIITTPEGHHTFVLVSHWSIYEILHILVQNQQQEH